MKIIKRVVVLVFLGACLVMIEKDQIAHAQTSCPERDQCLDDAYATYLTQINAADYGHLECIDEKTTSKNSCLDAAENGFVSCELDADYDYEIGLWRCQAIPDPNQQQHCMDEIDMLKENAYANCQQTLDNEVNSCWDSYYAGTLECDNVYFEKVSQAQTFLSLEYTLCDTLCD